MKNWSPAGKQPCRGSCMQHAPHLLDSLLVVDVAGGPLEPAQTDARLLVLHSPSLSAITGCRAVIGSACGSQKPQHAVL